MRSSRAERAVLHSHAALVAQEHDAVAGRERALATLGRDGAIRPELAGVPHPGAGELVEVTHVRARVRQDDLASIRIGLASRVPARNQRRLGLVLGRVRVHHAGPLVALQRGRGALRRELLASPRAARHDAAGAPR